VNKTTTVTRHASLTLLLSLLGASTSMGCGADEPDTVGTPVTGSPSATETTSSSSTAMQPTTVAPPPSQTAPTPSTGGTPGPDPKPTVSPALPATPDTSTPKPGALDPSPQPSTTSPVQTPEPQGAGGTGPSDGPSDGAGGAGGSMGAGGGGSTPTPDGPAAADPSDGCGKANPQTGSSGQPLNVSNHDYYVKLPQGYDENTPYPVVIMFNPTGNPITWAEQNAGFEAVAQDAIRIYPHMQNQSSGWGGGDFPFFEPFYEKITSDYCIDKARVFAGGESSGGEFVGALGCEHADKVRSVAPGAPKPMNGFELNASSRDCTGQVTAVVIHSPKDSVLAQPVGEQMRDFYKDLNHCDDASDPVEGYTDDMSNCVQFQGCDDGFPVYWCHHNDPEYGGTYHGWPHFAAKMLWELWSSY